MIQREGNVVHVVAYNLIDLSAELASVGGREAPFPLPHGWGDEFHRGPPAPDPRDRPQDQVEESQLPLIGSVDRTPAAPSCARLAEQLGR